MTSRNRSSKYPIK